MYQRLGKRDLLDDEYIAKLPQQLKWLAKCWNFPVLNRGEV